MPLKVVHLGLVLLAVPIVTRPARAEDFTGFYAGVNAGYAFDRSRRGSGDPTALSGAAASKDDPAGLPPSAQSASRSPAMRGSRIERPAQR